MASKTIDELKSLIDGGTKIDIRDNTNMLFAAQYNGAVYKVSGAEFFEEIAKGMDGHGGILSFEKTGSEGLVDTYTITYADGDVSTFTVSNGKGISSIITKFAISTSRTTAPEDWAENVPSTWSPSIPYLWAKQTYFYNNDETDEITYVCAKYGTGISSISQSTRGSDSNGKYTQYDVALSDGKKTNFKAYDGASIKTITKTGTDKLEDTYTVTLTDGTSDSKFVVTNGRSITGITGPETNKLVDTYAINFNNDTTQTFKVTNGRSITNIKRTGGRGGAGELDTYTITYNDGTTSTFTVQNGQNGLGSTKSVSGIQANSDGDIPVILQGESSPTKSMEGTKNQLYFDTANSLLYVCKGSDSTGYLWAAASVTVDSTLSSTSTNPVQNKAVNTAIASANTAIASANTAIASANTAIASKQPLTNSLSASNDLADGDYLPYYATSAKADKKTLWSNIVSAIRTKLFGTSNGFLKADGKGTISAVATIGTDDIAAKAVTNEKIAPEVKESTLTAIGGTGITSLASARGGTVVVTASASDFVIIMDGDNAEYGLGFEVAIMNMETQSTTIKFTTGNVVAYGLDSWLAANSTTPVLITLEKYSTIALKKIRGSSPMCWLVTGPCEISGGTAWNPYTSTSST